MTERIADADVPEITITQAMIDAGVMAFLSYDPRIQGEEIPVIRILRAALELGAARRVRLASDVDRALFPYLTRTEEISLAPRT